MSLQRRLLVYLLLCAPLAWAVALALSAGRARHEVNELFDTEMIRLARQVHAALALGGGAVPVPASPPGPDAGAAETADMAIAVWDAAGRRLAIDREGMQLPYRAGASGFVDLALDGQAWRVYYLQPPPGGWLVAAGQHAYERAELVRDLVVSQLLPWLLMLPLLLAAMAWAVRQALAPLRALTVDLQRRRADDLQPLHTAQVPRDLLPLLDAMNGLFARIGATLERERRFTADAAHELRTPLAVLRAQWDVVRGAGDAAQRRAAEIRMGAGLDRMDRLVTQLLALSRLEATSKLARCEAVDWVPVVEQVIGDCLPLADRRHIELACEWPPDGGHAFALRGDVDLLTVLLRNLVDNAVRHAPAGSTVMLRFESDRLAVDNGGPALSPQQLARLGERFHRGEATGSGSGLGVSIAQRIAALHGLVLRYRARADGSGVVAELGPS